MNDTSVSSPTHEQVLQLATERHVHAFDLSETARVSLGRHPSNDVQLRSMRVSSYHAEIVNEVDGLFINDLGSTNGTLVNDAIVNRRRLHSGDSIRIGQFTISVRLLPRKESDEGSEAAAVALSAGAIGNVLSFRSAVESEAREAAGNLDFTLPELLTRLVAAPDARAVVLRNPSEQGRIYIVDGSIVHAEAGGTRKIKALFRLLGLTKGTYEIAEIVEPDAVPRTIEAATESLLVEGMQEIEMMESLGSQLPPIVYELVLEPRCETPVSVLEPDELALYEALIRFRTILRVLEESPETDFNVLRIVLQLLEKGFFRPTSHPMGELEQTSAAASAER